MDLCRALCEASSWNHGSSMQMKTIWTTVLATANCQSVLIRTAGSSVHPVFQLQIPDPGLSSAASENSIYFFVWLHSSTPGGKIENLWNCTNMQLTNYFKQRAPAYERCCGYANSWWLEASVALHQLQFLHSRPGVQCRKPPEIFGCGCTKSS